MKAITLHQPWATLIALGVKTIETRSWPTKHRGPIAIHAGATTMPWWDLWHQAHRHVGTNATTIIDAVRDHSPQWLESGLFEGPDGFHADVYDGNLGSLVLPLGAVIATANLVDCLPMVEWGVDPTCDHLAVGPGGHPLNLWAYAPDVLPRAWTAFDPAKRPSNDGPGVDNRTDQLSFGDFAPGRFAWLLDDITPIEPIPERGHQSLWNTEAV